MTETEQRYHSNKQEFLALKWAVTEQFHEYLSPYGKNRNEFVVQTDNNPLTYIFSSANLDAAGQRWVAQLASYNFALEYQKGKDNTVANFLSHLDDCLPAGEVQDYLNKIPYPGVKAVLDSAITPLTDRAKQGVRPNPNNQKAGQEVTIGARPARLATTNITDWKRWVAQLASYNFALEYQKGKDNTVADFLSHLDDCLSAGEVQDYLNKIPYPGVKAVLDNAITPLTDRAKQGVRPNPNNQKAGQEVTIGARPARLATTNITDWKLEQQEDPIFYQVVKHRKAS